MFIWMPESGGPFVSLKVVGRLTDDAYQHVLPKLVEVVAREGSLRLFVDLSEFEGWDWQSEWDKAAFGIKYWDKVHRVALVGASGWATLIARIAAALTHTDVRAYDADECDAALAWVRAEADEGKL